MARSVVLNGTTFSIPQTGEDGWSSSGGVDDFLVALATGVLSKAGGTFTLTAEIDLGATYGIKGAYWKSKATNPAAAGAVRLGNTETVSWRNAGNSADLALTVNASDQLTFGGVPVAALSNGAANTVLGMNAAGTANEYKALTGTSNQVTVTHGVGTITLATPQSISTGSSPTFAGLTLTSFSGVVKAAAGVLSAATLVNADVDAAAAIAYSKLNLAGSVTNADLAGSIAYSKLVLTGSILNADLAGSIADTKLSTIATAGKVSNSATTATSSNTNSTIVARDGSGNFSAGTITATLSGNATSATTATSATSATTATTAGNVTGTVAIANGGTGQTAQTAAFDALAPNTTKGDLIVRGASNNVRLAVGTNGQVLTADSTATNGIAWGDASAGAGEINAVSNPSAASATTGWAAGTSHTVARDTSNSPLSPAISTSLAITATANAVESSTSGVGYTISTFPAGLRGRKNKVEFWITSPSADTWKVSVYTAGGTRVTLSTDSSGATTITAGVTGKFTTTFDADATTTSYIVRFTRTGGSGTTTLYVTNLVVGPGIQPQGAALGQTVSETSVTPTNFGTVTNTRLFSSRHGDRLHVEGTFDPGTLGAGLKLAIGGSRTVNSSAVTATANAAAVGRWIRMRSASSAVSSQDNEGIIFFDGTDTANLYFASAVASFALTKSDAFMASNERLYVEFTIPLAEWAGSGTVNLANSEGGEFASNSGNVTAANSADTSTFAYGSLGSPILAYNSASVTANQWTSFTVRFSTPIQTTDSVQLEFYDGNRWYPASSQYAPGTTAAGVPFGAWLVGTATATDVIVKFGNYGINFANAAWSNLTSTYRWRVRKINGGGQAVGFANATDTSTGLISRETTGTFTATVTGMSTVITGTMRYTVTGKTVTLYCPGITGTSNTTAQCTITGLPAVITPQRQQSVLGTFTDSGSQGLALHQITASSTILANRFTAVASITGGVTGSGTKGFPEQTFTYSLD